MTGELTGVEPCLGVSGAQMNCPDLSRLPVELPGLWFAIKVLVSGEIVEFISRKCFLLGISFKLYFKWCGSNGLHSDNSSGCLIPMKKKKKIKKVGLITTLFITD